MKIKDAKFITSALSKEQYPKYTFPEVALAGRSNVGKSSLINCVANRNNLARTSQRPGKTQMLNFYLFNDQLSIVDVPGYGYAKVSKKERERWGEMMERYFSERENLQKVFQVVDLRHKPTEDDQMMYNFLKYYELPVVVVATKADKLSKNKQQQNFNKIKNILSIDSHDEIIIFSAKSSLGREKLLRSLRQTL